MQEKAQATSSIKLDVPKLLGLAISPECIPGIEASLAMFELHIAILDSFMKSIASTE